MGRAESRCPLFFLAVLEYNMIIGTYGLTQNRSVKMLLEIGKAKVEVTQSGSGARA